MSIVMPGFVPDVHSSDALDPAWGNAVRDRAAQVFDTTTNRDAAITVPQAGQVNTLTTLGNAGLYIYAGPVDLWRPPWNLPWGEVARTVDVTNQGPVADSAEHTITAAATTLTAVANRLYRVTVNIPVRNAATANASITLRCKDGTTLIETARVYAVTGTTLAGTADYPASFEVETVLTAGAHTINLTMQSANAAGVQCTAGNIPLTIVVEDIGPSGAPS